MLLHKHLWVNSSLLRAQEEGTESEGMAMRVEPDALIVRFTPPRCWERQQGTMAKPSQGQRMKHSVVSGCRTVNGSVETGRAGLMLRESRPACNQNHPQEADPEDRASPARTKSMAKGTSGWKEAKPSKGLHRCRTRQVQRARGVHRTRAQTITLNRASWAGIHG